MKSKEELKESGRWLLSPLIRLCLRLKVQPNLLSLSSLPLSIGAGWLFSQGSFRWAGLLLLLVGIADTIDGAVARAQNRISTLGAFLDSVLDRCAEFFVLFGLYLHYSPNHPAELIPLLIFTSLMVSYLRARAEGLRLECRTGVFERPIRILLLVVGALILDPQKGFPLVLWILLAGTLFTIGQRVGVVIRRSRG